MKSTKNSTLNEIVFQTLESCGRSKGEVATDMGIPLSTLCRETSINDTGAKFGATALIPFMNATGCLAPLEFLADAMGKRLTDKNACPNGEDMRDESLQAWDAAAKFIKAANNEEMDYSTLLGLRNAVAKEMDDVLERRSPQFNALSLPVSGLYSALTSNKAEKKQ